MKTAKQQTFWLARLCILGGMLAGCGPSNSDQGSGGSESPAAQSQGRSPPSSAPQREKQAEFLNRIRQADPNYRTIQKAVLNENNELGLILDRNVEMDSIPNLLRSMLTELHKEFPGQDLTVVAYAPTQPPVRIGSGRLDSRTGELTYTPEQSPKR